VRSFGEFFGEIALWAVICLVGGVAVFLWGHFQVIAVLGLCFAALGAGWLGWAYRRRTNPDSSLIRRLVVGVLAAGRAVFVALVFLPALCACA
jgi:hypothetical protein